MTEFLFGLGVLLAPGGLAYALTESWRCALGVECAWLLVLGFAYASSEP